MLTRILALLLLILMSPLFLIISILIFLIDGLPVFFIQKRVGRNSSNFNMYKFRTMRLDTPNVATKLLENPEKYISKTGVVLRKFSLDELPNLINMVRGEMGFVGPRPVISSEYELINLRHKTGVDKLLPGLTGLAQINGRNDLPHDLKVEYELEYKEKRSALFDLEIILKTIAFSMFRKIDL